MHNVVARSEAAGEQFELDVRQISLEAAGVSAAWDGSLASTNSGRLCRS